MAVAPDGKVVVAGWATEAYAPQPHWDHEMLVVARFNADGTLDNTFGGDGRVTTDFGDSISISLNFPVPQQVLLQPNGDVLVSTRKGIVRYSADGTFDKTFGTGGFAVTGLRDVGLMSIQPDGGIAGTGFAIGDYQYTATHEFQLDGNGHRNGTADGDAEVAPTRDSDPDKMALQPDGKLIVVGHEVIPNTDHVALDYRSHFIVKRFDTDGQLDPTFGNGGTVSGVFSDAPMNQVSCVAVQPDGRIVLAGSTYRTWLTGNFTGLALARLNSDGSFDTAFGDGGKRVTAYGGIISAQSMSLDADGGIVLGVQTFSKQRGLRQIGVTRFDRDGNLDLTFGNGGMALPDFDTHSYLADMTVEPDGDILLLGSTRPNWSIWDPSEFVLARYINSSRALPNEIAAPSDSSPIPGHFALELSASGLPVSMPDPQPLSVSAASPPVTAASLADRGVKSIASAATSMDVLPQVNADESHSQADAAVPTDESGPTDATDLDVIWREFPGKLDAIGI